MNKVREFRELCFQNSNSSVNTTTHFIEYVDNIELGVMMLMRKLGITCLHCHVEIPPRCSLSDIAIDFYLHKDSDRCILAVKNFLDTLQSPPRINLYLNNISLSDILNNILYEDINIPSYISVDTMRQLINAHITKDIYLIYLFYETQELTEEYCKSADLSRIFADKIPDYSDLTVIIYQKHLSQFPIQNLILRIAEYCEYPLFDLHKATMSNKLEYEKQLKAELAISSGLIPPICDIITTYTNPSV